MTRSRKRACLAQRDSVDEPARQGGGRTSTTNWLRQVCSRAWRSGGGQCAGGREGWLGCRERRGRADGARALRCRGSSGSGRTPVQSRVLRCALALFYLYMLIKAATATAENTVHGTLCPHWRFTRRQRVAIFTQTSVNRKAPRCRGVSHGARVTNTVTDGVVSVSNGVSIRL